MRVLVVNAGSTTLKLALVEHGETRSAETLEPADAAARERFLDAAGGIDVVGHRVVHGGSSFREPVLIDDAVVEAIRDISALAPLHNEPALRAIAALREARPALPQVAAFDTAFHATLPEAASVLPLPWRWTEAGIRRYGFHGLSVAWSARRAPEVAGGPLRRLVVCHLGGGCSITAVLDGASVDTTMGFTPLDGVPMATRSGALDPGVLLHLLRDRGVSLDELDHALAHESGLLGLSGLSPHVRELEQAAAGGSDRARLALDVYVRRIAAAVAALTTSLGGLDGLVFTAGVGEHGVGVRAQVCARLAFLGVELDEARNGQAAGDAEIGATSAAVRILVIQAREELMIARAAADLLGA